MKTLRTLFISGKERNFQADFQIFQPRFCVLRRRTGTMDPNQYIRFVSHIAMGYENHFPLYNRL